MRTRVVLTSGGEDPVLDQGGGQNSVFTKALPEVLRQNTGILAGIDLFSAIRTEVMLNAAQRRYTVTFAMLEVTMVATFYLSRSPNPAPV